MSDSADSRRAQLPIIPADRDVDSGPITSGTPVAIDLGTALIGKMVTFEAVGGNLFIFGAATAAAVTVPKIAAGDPDRGFRIPSGESRDFWVHPSRRFIQVDTDTSTAELAGYVTSV